MKRLWSIQSLLWLALVLALVGSLRHVAWGFSTLESGDLIAGYVQAVAVDVGLFALAIGIQDRRRQARPTLALWIGAGLFSLVSTYANLLHGLYFATDIGLSSWAWLVAARPVILSGVLPALVIYLSEVAGDDRNYNVKLAEREARKATREPSKPVAQFDIDTLLGAFGVNRDDALQLIKQYDLTPDTAYSYLRDKLPEGMTKDQFVKLFNELTGKVSNTVTLDAQPDTLTQARAVKADSDAATKAAALDTILATLTANPDTAVTELARLVGKSRQTVYGYLSELETAGRLRRNGHTEIVQAG